MATFRRYYIEGGCYFFTLVTHRRQALLVKHIDALRGAFRRVKQRYPFYLDAIVVLPDHLHCIMSLPDGDKDYPKRIRLIKHSFSRALPTAVDVCAQLRRRGERGLWQRRYWEHVIRDEVDYQRHMDYIHFNPVKHGYVERVSDWPYSSFHRCVKEGVYAPSWGEDVDVGWAVE